MLSTNNITLSYIDENYDEINKIREDITVLRSRIDGKKYLLKALDVYDTRVYRLLQECNNPGIPRIYEMAEVEGTLYIVEEYLDGETLDKYVYNIKDQKDIINIAKQICSILEGLHYNSHPIIHRDIKPENIIISDKKVYLIDFNISRKYLGDSNRDTVLMGTREYAAPEQYGFSESDVRTDIYGLGATVKYIIDNTNISSHKISRFITKCTEIDPDNRFQSVIEARGFLNNRFSGYIFENRFKYALPGYRTGNIYKAVLATMYYVLAIRMSFLVDVDGAGVLYNMLFGIYQFIILMSAPIIIFDYMNIHRWLHINKLKWYFRYPIALIISIIFGVIMSVIFIFFDILISPADSFIL